MKLFEMASVFLVSAFFPSEVGLGLSCTNWGRNSEQAFMLGTRFPRR